MAIFETAGTINVTTGSTAVTGNDTNWIPSYDGVALVIAGGFYPVASINSPTSITLMEPYNGPTANARSYVVAPIAANNLDLTKQTLSVLKVASDLTRIGVGPAGPAGPAGPKGGDGNSENVVQAIEGAPSKNKPSVQDEVAMIDSEDNSKLKRVRFDTLRSTLAKPNTITSLFVYYGYPIALNGLYNVDAVIAAISKYDIWVCGDTYQHPTQEVYASTVQIIKGVRAKGTKVYGYVPMGFSQTNAQKIEGIDQWHDIGVDGIFLDEYGFDYQVTRAQQIVIVDYAHSRGLPICANAFIFEDAVCDNINELVFPSNDFRYQNFAAMNPNNLPSPHKSGDSYLIENFVYNYLGPANKFDVQERNDLIAKRNKKLKTPMLIWGLAVFPERTDAYGTIDFSKMGSLPYADVPDYIAANAFMFDLDAVGAGAYTFGAGSKPVEMFFPGLPPEVNTAEMAQNPVFSNLVTAVAYRDLSRDYRLTITNSDTKQAVTISSASSKLLKSTSNG